MKNLKIYTQNTRGLNTKIKMGLRDRTSLFSFDMYALTETWLQSNIHSSELFDESFSVYRSDRKLSQSVQGGGGVLVALKNSISSIRIPQWENEIPFENVWLKINTNGNTKLFFNVIYLKSRFDPIHLKIYLDHLSDIILSREPNAKFVIMGDFNMSNITWESVGDHCVPLYYEGNSSGELINTLHLTSLNQLNAIKNNYNKTLDLVLSNVNLSVTHSNDLLVPEDPYHPALSINVDIANLNIKFMNAIKTPKRNFRKANYIELNQKLSNINWVKELDHDDVNVAVNKFYLLINGLIQKYVPLSTPRSDQFPIWFSKELIGLIREKEYYGKLMKHSNNIIYKQLFSKKRHEIKIIKKRNYFSYINNIEKNVVNNPKCFFSYTKSLKQSNRLPNSMHLLDDYSEDMHDTCNLFARHFSEVYVPGDTVDELVNDCTCNDYLSLNEHQITQIISTFDINKTNSPDLIPMLFYNKTANNIALPLKLLYNLSSRTSIYPDRWKTSIISPIHKSGDKSNIENYRPISIISAISKIFERAIHNHISIITKDLISIKQHGFRTGKSTLSNLLEYDDYLVNNMVKGSQVDTIFTDMSKAFDKVSHNILLKKLATFRLNKCLIKLIESFLKNRKQIVCVYGAKSSEIEPTSSVPQGSVLSPLLFSLFINDLPDNILCQILMFADDVKIFNKISNLNDARKLQNDIDQLFNWCRTNGLELNINKCYVMSTTRKLTPNVHLFNYNINSAPLIRVDAFKDLGVTFDSKHTFEEHVKSMCTRSFKTLGFIARSLYKFKNLGTYTALYSMYVRSSLEYCSPIWSPHYVTYVDQIERVQKRFTRKIFTKFHYPNEKYDMRLIRLELLSLFDRRMLTDELTFFKIYNKKIHTSLFENITHYNANINLRRRNLFYLPFVTTNIEYHSAINRMQRRHDEVFQNIELLNVSLDSFKRYAKYELFSRQPHMSYRELNRYPN